MSGESTESLLELGDRYAAMGLGAAARGAYERAHRVCAANDARPARRLAKIALAHGDAGDAREFAEVVAARAPGPAARLLLGQTRLEAGAYDAARLAFGSVLEIAGPNRLLRASAHLGIARVASLRGDQAGAGANSMAALEEVLLVLNKLPARLDDASALADEAIRCVVANGRSDDLRKLLDDRRAPGLLCALAMAARQAHGDAAVRDRDIDAALAELSREPCLEPTDGAESIAPEASLTWRLYVAERELRRRNRDRSARVAAIEDIEALLATTADAAPGTTEGAARSRAQLLLATAREDEPASAANAANAESAESAESAYRQALSLQPANAAIASRLAQLSLARGDVHKALCDVERALRIGAADRQSWRNAARVLVAHGSETEEAVARMLAAACPGSGADYQVARAVGRLFAAGSETARDLVLAGVHARGHRLKNLLGIVGSRARSARKLTEEGDELCERLQSLETVVTSLYDEWAGYLRSLQSPAPGALELVPVAALVEEVARAARERSTVPVDVHIDSGLPDLRGDRVLLREALLNVVNNAVEACAVEIGNDEVRDAAPGRVTITARAVRSGGPVVVEIEVADTGPGIARSDLARVLSPGFTTKESGSGVGLVIAERVISAHHGRLTLHSELGEGTRVSLLVPVDLAGFAGLAPFSSGMTESPGSYASERGSES